MPMKRGNEAWSRTGEDSYAPNSKLLKDKQAVEDWNKENPSAAAHGNLIWAMNERGNSLAENQYQDRYSTLSGKDFLKEAPGQILARDKESMRNIGKAGLEVAKVGDAISRKPADTHGSVRKGLKGIQIGQ